MNKKEISVFAIAFVCSTILICFMTAYSSKRIYPKDDNVQVVFIGDSNIAFERSDTDIPMLVADQIGVTTYNCALGGTLASNIDLNDEYDYYYDNCCFYNLSNLIVTGDRIGFEDNPKAIMDEFELANLRVKLLSILDFSKVDYLFVTYGTNDYLMGVTITDPDDPYNIRTYTGAMRSSLEKIMKRYPQMKIVVTSPTFVYDEKDGQIISGRELDYGGGTLEDYRDALEALADEYDNVYFMDALNLVEIDESNCKAKMEDREHMNKEALTEWANAACELINQLESSK